MTSFRRVVATHVLAGSALLSGAALTPAGVAAVVPSRQATTATPVLSERSLLARLTSTGDQLTPLPSGVTVSQVSSHDLGGGNLDGGSYNPIQAPVLPLTYVRRAGDSYVLADERGPGCLVRIWMTSSASVQGNTASFGHLQLFFDGKHDPTVDESVARIFAGRDRRFPRPLVNDYVHSSGGNYSYIPFCFSRRLEVRVTGQLATMANFFQLTFLDAPTGTPVRTFSGGAKIARAAAQLLDDVGRAPEARPTRTAATARLRSGDAVGLPTLTGPGSVRYLRFTVKPFDIDTLNALSLRVDVDGARKPQVNVPLAAVFGDGIETREIRSLAFGMDPSTQSGYLALPIPYRHLAHIWVASHGVAAAVRVEAWTGAPPATTAHLYGQQVRTRTRFGHDFPVLRAGGSGRLASYVMDIRDSSTPLSGDGSAQWFMEGDERAYVDGLRSPSLYGTGTEDEFNGGYYFNQGPFTLPFNGAGPLGQVGVTQQGTQSAYRVFADDGITWSDSIEYGQQAGGNNERLPETAVATTFSYRDARQLVSADQVALGNPTSRRAHHLTGAFSTASLDAYFEGARDGTLPVSTTVIGGSYYLSPPPQASADGLAAQGIAFSGPISVTLHVAKRNRGVVLRRLQDQRTVVPVAVAVDGHQAGVWEGGDFQGNQLKRWLESDFAIPASLTAGRSRLVVTLRPTKPGTTATAYSLRALVRT